MSVNKKVWFYDLEQFPNFHCGTYINRDDPTEIRTFIIYEDIDQSREYYEFLTTEVAGLIGFNNLNYDYPLIHYFINVMRSLSNGIGRISASNLINLLFNESYKIIQSEYSEIPVKYTLIPQLDLFRIHHFDNKNKSTSLKELEIVMKFDNVMDIPLEPLEYVKLSDIDKIIEYNINDVRATAKFYTLSVDMIEMRKKLGKKYGLNLINANDPKIGERIFLKNISEKKRISFYELKDMRTYRHKINLGECILPYIKFNSKQFNRLLDELKSTTIETTYKAFEKSVIYKGFRYDYGTGGIHGCIKSGIYEEDDNYLIVDIDVKSYYPNLAIKNNFYPLHLGPDFITVYDELFHERLKAQVEKDSATNSGLKLALNGTYGKSNDKYSPLYDPKYTMQITVNGQLLLSMLAEDIIDNLPFTQILQINTDGITIRIRKEEIDWLYEICKKWELMTKLTLEYARYKKMVIRDVNNYMAIDINGKAKHKGAFEIIPMQNGAIAYNKDWSMRVVPKALDAYYREGIPIEQFIRSHTDIFDFCIGFRANKDWSIIEIYAEDGLRKERQLQKTVRYYISEVGGMLIKRNTEDRREIQLNSGFSSTVFNIAEYKPINKYRIDYDFYISEANRVKNAVYDGQLSMF